MSKNISTLKDFIFTAAYAILLVIFVLSSPKIFKASQALLDKSGSINTIEVEGVKIAFDQETVAAPLNAFSYLNDDAKANVLRKMKSLEPEEFERLMSVGALNELCEFERPNLDILHSLTLDQQLKAKGLVTISDSPSTKTAVKQKIKAGEIASGKPSDIGYPSSCYVMKFTDAGFDTKTALVKVLSEAFRQKVASK